MAVTVATIVTICPLVALAGVVTGIVIAKIPLGTKPPVLGFVQVIV